MLSKHERRGVVPEISGNRGHDDAVVVDADPVPVIRLLPVVAAQFRMADHTSDLRPDAELVDIEGKREIDPGFMRRALEAPLHTKMRADFEARLARAGQ